MNRMLALAGRTGKELLRDPVTLVFGVGLPLFLLVLMSVIQNNVPVEIFAIGQLAPGMAAFSLSFVSMFAAILLAKDKSTSFLLRVFASPALPREYILGYALPMLPIGAAQCAVCFLTAFCFGLAPSWNILLAMLVLLPTAALYIAFGLLFAGGHGARLFPARARRARGELCGHPAAPCLGFRMGGAAFCSGCTAVQKEDAGKLTERSEKAGIRPGSLIHLQ